VRSLRALGFVFGPAASPGPATPAPFGTLTASPLAQPLCRGSLAGAA
jgi:hypothetical protein